MTPYQIGIVLHYCTSSEDHPHVVNPPPIWRETIEMLTSCGLLQWSDPSSNGGATYEPTEMAYAYFDALCRVPLPRREWVVPGFPKP